MTCARLSVTFEEVQRACDIVARKPGAYAAGPDGMTVLTAPHDLPLGIHYGLTEAGHYFGTMGSRELAGGRVVRTVNYADRPVHALLKARLEEQYVPPAHVAGRRGRCVREAIHRLSEGRRGGGWVVSADVRGFFEEAKWDAVAQEARAVVSEGLVTAVEAIAEASGRRTLGAGWSTTNVLADILLRDVDELLARFRFVIRYVDDIALTVDSETEAEFVLSELRTALGRVGLRLHPGKVRVIPPDEPFELLGITVGSDGRLWVPEASCERMLRRLGPSGQSPVEVLRDSMSYYSFLDAVLPDEWQDRFRGMGGISPTHTGRGAATGGGYLPLYAELHEEHGFRQSSPTGVGRVHQDALHPRAGAFDSPDADPSASREGWYFLGCLVRQYWTPEHRSPLAGLGITDEKAGQMWRMAEIIDFAASTPRGIPNVPFSAWKTISTLTSTEEAYLAQAVRLLHMLADGAIGSMRRFKRIVRELRQVRTQLNREQIIAMRRKWKGLPFSGLRTGLERALAALQLREMLLIRALFRHPSDRRPNRNRAVPEPSLRRQDIEEGRSVARARRLQTLRNRQASDRQERIVAGDVGGRLVPGSGSGSRKGDVRVAGRALLECKVTSRPYYRFVFTDFQRLAEAAGVDEEPLFVVWLRGGETKLMIGRAPFAAEARHVVQVTGKSHRLRDQASMVSSGGAATSWCIELRTVDGARYYVVPYDLGVEQRTREWQLQSEATSNG